jgi:ATP-binding cassette subfamily D (ALD) long-chain fatty acid import protein
MLGMGDNGDEWEFERIGTEREKMQVEKEVQELRERLAEVNELKKRRDEIEVELASVWTDKGKSLPAPAYTANADEEEPEMVEHDNEEDVVAKGNEEKETQEEPEVVDA